MWKTDSVQFPALAQRVVHQAAINLIPLELSLSTMGDGDSALAESCTQFHHFMLAMLEDMVNNAGAYGLHPGELEAFLDGRAINAMKRREPKKTEKFLAVARGAADRYQLFLYFLGAVGEPTSMGMMLTEEAYGAVCKHSAVKKIPLETRLAALKRVGLCFGCVQGGVLVSSERYPQMFVGMCALAKASQPPNHFGAFLFCLCEFRRIAGPYVPVYEDYMHPLDAQKRAVADAIHRYALSLGLRVSVTTYWKINYLYKGKHVMCLETSGNTLRLRVDGGPREWYLEQIHERGEGFIRYFLRHLNYCTACSPSHIGGLTKVFGHTKRICCWPSLSFRIQNPGMDDLENIERFIDFRCAAIQNEKKGAAHAVFL